MKNIVKIYIILLSIIGFYSCDDPYKDETFKVYNEQPIASYLDTRSDDFSEWIKILKYADLYNALNQATQTYTVFAPTNQAVKAFYEKKKVSSIDELGKEYARQLTKYHIVGDSISLDDFVKGGILVQKTLTDDFLEVTFGDDSGEGDGGYNSLYMNEEVHVKELAISTSNGLVYVLDGVMRPMIESLYQQMADNDKNNILIEAMKLTSWNDSLNIIADTIIRPNGSKQEVRRYYSVFGVSDQVYNSKGINSVQDLISKLGADNDYKNKDNALFRYVGYHILRGNYRLADMKVVDNTSDCKLWETSIQNTLIKFSKEADGNYYMNYDGGSEYKAWLVEDESNYLVKNGYIHQIDNYLPICRTLKPVPTYFDFCNFPEVASYIASNGVDGQIYQTAGTKEFTTDLTGGNLACYKYEVGPLGLASSGIKVGYLTVTDKTTNAFYNALYKDVLELRLGYLGNITVNTPPILPGKYKITLVYLYANSLDPLSKGEGSNGGQTIFSFENIKYLNPAKVVLYSKETLDGRMGIYTKTLYDEVDFLEMASHPIKITINDPAASTFEKFQIRFDYILFEPIN